MAEVRELMTRRVISVDMDTPLRQIKNLFDNVRIHHLPVLDRGQLVGIISDRDVLGTLSPAVLRGLASREEERVLRKPAHQIMSRNLVTVTPETPFESAIATMLNAHVSALPVVDGGTLVGIVSWRDLLREQLRLQPLAASQPELSQPGL